MTLSTFKNFTDRLNEQEQLMPVLFIGHGSPMNGIEDTIFNRNWAKMANEIPTPTAVLVVSAHWLSKGTKITAMDFPKTIHDFSGFPPELFAIQYPASGNPLLAKETAGLIHSTNVELDHDWGLDHGTWAVVRHMYPNANIPVLQLSIDYTKGSQYHYDLAKELYALRKKGVLIIGSGNMVHNLRMVAWDKLNEPLGTATKLAIPTPEHYLPLLYTLGLKSTKDNISFFNDKVVGGSLTMTSVKIG